MSNAPVAGFLYSSEHDLVRNATVCKIVSRAEPDFGCGAEPTFMVEFSDGCTREVLGQQLNPWFPV